VGPLGPIYLIILTPKQNKQNKSPHFAANLITTTPLRGDFALESPIRAYIGLETTTNHLEWATICLKWAVNSRKKPKKPAFCSILSVFSLISPKKRDFKRQNKEFP